MQAAIAADSRRYNVFTFLEDESLDDVITSGDHVTTPPEVGEAAGTDAKQDDDGLCPADDEAEPLVTGAAGDSSAASAAFVTSSPTKSSEDVADLEFKGNC